MDLADLGEANAGHFAWTCALTVVELAKVFAAVWISAAGNIIDMNMCVQPFFCDPPRWTDFDILRSSCHYFVPALKNCGNK